MGPVSPESICHIPDIIGIRLRSCDATEPKAEMPVRPVGWHKREPIAATSWREAQTFLATFKKDDAAMKTLAVISILALLTISGAAYTDQMLTSERQAGQRAN